MAILRSPGHPSSPWRLFIRPARGSDILPALSRQILYTILNERTARQRRDGGSVRQLFGNGAGFWANLQRSYDLAVAERTVDVTGIPPITAQVVPNGERAAREPRRGPPAGARRGGQPAGAGRRGG